MTPEEREKAGAYGREVIFRYYSVTRMAQDSVKAYDAAWKESHEKQYHVVMSGYYGFNNTGDEAIMLSMHKNIQGLGTTTILQYCPTNLWKQEKNMALKLFIVLVCGMCSVPSITVMPSSAAAVPFCRTAPVHAL